uniref:Uncharacterized protein n=1 Tax=Parascaris equorum TaxID=6256 RepID=A0A914RI53_PAREQ
MESYQGSACIRRDVPTPSTLNPKREPTTMFMVSTTNAVPIYTSYTAIAPSSSSCDIGRMFSDMNIGIEIDFSSITSKSFMVRISAPNNEMSNLLVFSTYGTTGYFCPKMDGCGHGMWTFEVLQQDGSRLVTVASQTMYLDGVGSLFFTVGDDFEPRLSSREFLRLPSACRCCCRQRLFDESL